MKKRTVFAAALLCLVFAANANKIALIIAVGNYPNAGGWPSLSSANDAELVRDALARQGFAERSIVVLRDAEATRSGILSAINQHLLGRVQYGDEVYFQFSGHGQQVADNNGDELDGLDEAIVPYDSPLRFEPGVYEGQNLVRDDELGDLFGQIRRRAGPNGSVLVVLDACHSGTGTRGMATARGTDKIMADSAWLAKRVGSRGTAGTDAFSESRAGEGLAPMAAFFGSAHNQLNFETQDESGRRVGSLSYCFSKTFSRASPNTTYRGIFEKIRLEMASVAPRQTPQAEGDLDRALLGGDLPGTAPYFQVKSEGAADFGNAEVPIFVTGGWLHGLTDGSVVGFYAPETRDPKNAQPFVRGTVTTALPTESRVQLDGNADPAQLAAAWVFVLEQAPGDLRCKLRLNFQDPNLEATLRERLAAVPVIQLSEPADLVLSQNGNLLELLAASGEQTLETYSASMPMQTLENKLKKRVFAFAQAKFLRGLNLGGNDLNVEMEIIPVEIDPRTQKETARIPLSQMTDATGAIAFSEGATFKIKVSNRGGAPAYFTLVDIQPDNALNILIPGDRETPEEFRIPPGEVWEIPRIFEIAPPFGAEVFKLLATAEPVDLRPIAATGGNLTRGPASSNPLEKLFSETYFTPELQTRGGKARRMAAGSVGVSSVTFSIVPK